MYLKTLSIVSLQQRLATTRAARKTARGCPLLATMAFSLAATFAMALSGCEATTSVETTASASEDGQNSAHPIFWQVDSKATPAGEAGSRLYLLGSIHVGPKEGWQLPASTLAHFEQASALVVEVDMSEGTDEQQDNAVLGYGLLPPGESVKNHISKDVYESLEKYIENSGRSMVNINQWRAWMVATMLLSFEVQRLGYPTEAGLDLELMARVSSAQRIIGLETMSEQLALLGGMSPDNQELMLKDMLLQTDDIEAYFNELKEAWRNGDEAGLTTVLFRELEATPELAPFYEKVIYGRNETMCARLDTLMQNGETLFGVVGAYHLVGPRGIPACLSARGYEVKRLDRAAAEDSP